VIAGLEGRLADWLGIHVRAVRATDVAQLVGVVLHRDFRVLAGHLRVVEDDAARAVAADRDRTVGGQFELPTLVRPLDDDQACHASPPTPFVR
jgi:hypothetical protein